MRQRGGRGGRGVRLRLGRGLRGGVLLASEDRVPAKREAVHAEAKQSLQPDTGLNPDQPTTILGYFICVTGLTVRVRLVINQPL